MADVGTAYLALVPKLKEGWNRSINSSLSNGVNGKSVGASAGGGFTSGFGSAIKGLATSAVVVGIAAKAGEVFMASFNSAAEAQQLEGGVDKLFGSASDTVKKQAAEAYKTIGMSSNEYMSQATSFSASLIQSLGGDQKKAAEQTQVAMQAMADNVSIFGSNAQDVQNAYQGFAKQNYTMLDNLKLGYGGTKTEMERLIKDANEWGKANGGAADLTIDSYSDVITAIQQIQEKQGIAGNAAMENSKTVSGSIESMKSSWDNLITAFGTGEGVDEAFGNFAESVSTAMGNVIPLVGEILSNVGNLIYDNAPELLDKALSNMDVIASGISENAPVILNKVVSLVMTLANVIVSHAPDILRAALTALGGFVKAIPKILPTIVSGITSMVKQLPLTIVKMTYEFANAGGHLIEGLWNGLKNKFSDWLLSKVSGLVNMLPAAVKKALGIASPSKVFAELGMWSAAGFEQGFEGKWKSTVSNVNGYMDFSAGGASGYASAASVGGVVINLNYDASADANQMVMDIANGLQRLNLMGA